MICQKCGNQLNADSVFCGNCGTSQNVPAQPVPQQHVPPQQIIQPPPVQQQVVPPVQQPPPPPQQFVPPPLQQPPPPQQFVQPPPQQFIPQTHSVFPSTQPPAVKKSKTPIFIALGIAVVGIIIAIIIATSGSSDTNDPGPGNRGDDVVIVTPGPSSEILTPAQVYEKNVDSVFQIQCDIDNIYVGWGSGFFISETGIAVTNHHVLDDIHSARVIMEDGSVYEITGYYNYDFGNDLAVIQVDGRGRRFQPVTIGNPDNLSVGDRVYAIGGPGGDPLTLTEGIISRFAHEPISYNIYTVAGMLQSTAFIYGGNSGGPLFNDRGHVIGINSAGRIDRESTQWAVPVDRVEIPAAGATIYPLPIGTSTPIYVPGEIFGFERFPDIPDFLSVSRNASLLISGTAIDLGYDLVLDIDEAGIYNFDYAYLYLLAEEHFIPDTDVYDEVLEDHGFIFQGVELVTEDDDLEVTYVFLYNSRLNMSLVYCYNWNYEFLLMLIGRGNTFEILGGSVSDRDVDFTGYTLFPFVPDFGELVPRAQLIGYGFAREYGIDDEFRLDGNLYMVSDDYVFIYHLPEQHLSDGEIFIELLLDSGFITERQTYYEDFDIAAELYFTAQHDVFVSLLYAYEDEELWIVIG